VLGGIVAGGVLYLTDSGTAGFNLSDRFAANRYTEHSPDGYNLLSGFITENVLMMVYLQVIIGETDKRAPQALTPVAFRLRLRLKHRISIPKTKINF